MSSKNQNILLGRSQDQGLVYILPAMMNRHGMIAGATGTGKSVTLQVLAEALSSHGVPVFLADVKGDLSGLAAAGKTHPKIEERLQKIGIENFQFHPFPVHFWDVFGESGHPLRATLSEMGPVMLAQLLRLNEVQEGTLNLLFKRADDEGLLLLDLIDLKTLLTEVIKNPKEWGEGYGHLSKSSLGAIQRALLQLEQEGAETYFGEPSFNFWDWLQTDLNGHGYINILSATKLFRSPKVYASFLLWMLSELFENLPEVGDLEKPRLVFFFEEAHLLFEETPPLVQEKIEQMVRLIRSKGVGIFFVTQNPWDLPEDILSQLGNRIQHSLRALTPKDAKRLRDVASTFRTESPKEIETALSQMGVGEALVSTLDEKGIPSVTTQTLMVPPESRMGPILETERQSIIQKSQFFGRYEQAIDRISAYERLQQRAEEKAQQAISETQNPISEKAREQNTTLEMTRPRRGDSFGTALAKSVARSMGTQLGRSLLRGLLGSFSRRR